MDKEKKKPRAEKRPSVTSTNPSIVSSPAKRRRSSASNNSKISQITLNNKSFSPSPRRKQSKKVSFKTDFIQLIPIESYKKYNNTDYTFTDTKCRCLIV